MVCSHARRDNPRTFLSGLSTVLIDRIYRSYLVCTTISHVEVACYEVPYAQELGTCMWVSCYNSKLCATGINVTCGMGKYINPRFRFKIKASYIVSTEVDVRMNTVQAVEAIDLNNIKSYIIFYLRGIQALQGDVLLSHSCKISSISLRCT